MGRMAHKASSRGPRMRIAIQTLDSVCIMILAQALRSADLRSLSHRAVLRRDGTHRDGTHSASVIAFTSI
jgi:hypothetical protein